MVTQTADCSTEKDSHLKDVQTIRSVQKHICYYGDERKSTNLRVSWLQQEGYYFYFYCEVSGRCHDLRCYEGEDMTIVNCALNNDGTSSFKIEILAKRVANLFHTPRTICVCTALLYHLGPYQQENNSREISKPLK